MENELLLQLNEWHEKDEFNNIIDRIKLFSPEELSFDLIGHLARAYNNIEE